MFRRTRFSAAAIAVKKNFPNERLHEQHLYSGVFSVLEVVVGVNCSEGGLLDLSALELLA